MRRDQNTPSRERELLNKQLEALRVKLPPYEYAVASAHIIEKLKRLNTKPRYALT